MKGGNLIHAKQTFLFNTLDTKDFGAYEDSVTSLWHLVIKEHGVDLTGGTTGDGALPENVYAKATATNIGTKQALILDLSPPYPDTDLNYDAWLSVMSKAKHDGFTNQYVEPARNYNYVIPQLAAASGGNLDPADGSDVDLINEKLINAITNDSGAVVEAGLANKITCDASASDSTFDIGATTYTGVGGTAALSAAALIVSVNAGSQAYAYAVSGDTASLWIIQRDGGFVTPDNPVVCAISAATLHYLGLVAKSVDQQFYVAYDNEEWATQVEADAGAYPILGYEEMCRIFSVKDHQAGGYVDQPLNASYTKYSIRVPITKHPGITGASSTELRYREVEIYILTSLLSNDYWDATNHMYEDDDASFTADTNFPELLEDVFFVAPGSW